MKIGDKVQFLSEIGGGKIAGFQGKDIALVEDEDGFQIPTPISDLVVTSSGEEYSSSRSVVKKGGAEQASETADPDTFNMSVKAKINATIDDEFIEEEEYDAADREITYRAKVEERKATCLTSIMLLCQRMSRISRNQHSLAILSTTATTMYIISI